LLADVDVDVDVDDKLADGGGDSSPSCDAAVTARKDARAGEAADAVVAKCP
jgi:hypothetical protein